MTVAKGEIILVLALVFLVGWLCLFGVLLKREQQENIRLRVDVGKARLETEQWKESARRSEWRAHVATSLLGACFAAKGAEASPQGSSDAN
jgi:hypothetical protein